MDATPRSPAAGTAPEPLTLRGGPCDPVTNPVRPLVQGQLWESAADAVTHAWPLGCRQKLGQPGARDLPVGLAGWQDAATQPGFLSPSGN